MIFRPRIFSSEGNLGGWISPAHPCCLLVVIRRRRRSDLRIRINANSGGKTRCPSAGYPAEAEGSNSFHFTHPEDIQRMDNGF